MYLSHEKILGIDIMNAANLYFCALMGLIMNMCPSRNAYLGSKLNTENMSVLGQKYLKIIL